MGVPPPPFRRIGNFRFFPRLFSCFFWNFKMIIYAPWNRFCMIQRTRLRSTGLSTLKKEEKKANLWITFGSQEHNEVYCSTILLNLILLTKILNNNGTLRINIIVWGGYKNVNAVMGKSRRRDTITDMILHLRQVFDTEKSICEMCSLYNFAK